MGINFLEIVQKYSQFQQLLKQTKRNPAELLESELKKRNISTDQLKDLIQQAKDLSQIIGGRK